jgi:hypothetical protein
VEHVACVETTTLSNILVENVKQTTWGLSVRAKYNTGLADDKVQWQAIVNAVIDPRIPNTVKSLNHLIRFSIKALRYGVNSKLIQQNFQSYLGTLRV